jgi:hypothetical protein
MIELAGGLGKEVEKELFSNFSSRRLTSHNGENEAKGGRASARRRREGDGGELGG